MRYYSVFNKYNEGKPSFNSCHIIKAKNKEDCLRIVEKYGIANPFKRVPIERIIKVLDCRLSWNKERIKRRKKGLGGHIWMEINNSLMREG